ncbi:MAG: hypothetical protein VYA71_02470 [Pseudomonadota bacterium]|nr:hypothetical protein [Pseudomonadota bacterium]
MSGDFHAVVWDVDGVLIDSEPLDLSSFIETYARLAILCEAATSLPPP